MVKSFRRVIQGVMWNCGWENEVVWEIRKSGFKPVQFQLFESSIILLCIYVNNCWIFISGSFYNYFTFFIFISLFVESINT